jgi:hypothetical protein
VVARSRGVHEGVRRVTYTTSRRSRRRRLKRRVAWFGLSAALAVVAGLMVGTMG